jgi:hypothetical protein
MTRAEKFAKLDELAAEYADARRRETSGRAPITRHTAKNDRLRVNAERHAVVATMSDADVVAYSAHRRRNG